MSKYLNLLRSLLRREFVIDQRMLGLKRPRRIAVPAVTNYIRISTLELAAQEIYERAVAGAVAEVGVYKGMFAKHVNAAFPDRRFFLFDTFKGFDEQDVQVEKSRQFSRGNQDFSDTSAEAVLAKMPFPQQCVIKQGWFPQSLDGLDEAFCFVSLDADLYKPIYDGLCYFYPRLNSGGYIFVHDYNNAGYEGAKAAVRDYCREQGIGYSPMSDSWGSAIIAK
jgi:O-methyltransferase